MFSPGEVVPGSRDTGSGMLHRLLRVVWVVTCACTQVLGGSSDRVSGSCPSLGSELIAVAHFRLWSSFRWCSAFCGHTGKESPLLTHPKTMVSCLFVRSRNPLSSRTPKQWSLASLSGPHFSPDSLPASCGALAPFRLSLCSQLQSSPWV